MPKKWKRRVIFAFFGLAAFIPKDANAGPVCGPNHHQWRGNGTPTVTHIVASKGMGYGNVIWCVPNR